MSGRGNKSMRQIHKQAGVTRMDDQDCPKGWEVNAFALTDALKVHVENLIAYYGEEAVRRQLAISSKKKRAKGGMMFVYVGSFDVDAFENRKSYKTGITYCIRVGGDRLKIGFTNRSLGTRLYENHLKFKQPIELLFAYKGGYRLENCLINVFKQITDNYIGKGQDFRSFDIGKFIVLNGDVINGRNVPKWDKNKHLTKKGKKLQLIC